MPLRQSCCYCFSKKTGTILTGVSSTVGNLLIVLPCVYALIEHAAWEAFDKMNKDWVEHRLHWDREVTTKVIEVLQEVDRNYQVLLIVLIIFCGLHMLNAMFLIFGAMLEKRLLFLPWMIQDVLCITVMTLIFVAWAFLSFFVHVLVAILFPVFAGLLLGLWIYQWRNVQDLFVEIGQDLADDISLRHGTVYKKLNTATSGSSGSSGGRWQSPIGIPPPSHHLGGP